MTPPYRGGRRTRWALYLALLLLRFLGVTQRGYVHPDEFFQGGAELFFGRHQEGDGTHQHQVDGGGGEPHVAKSVPWEFEPQNAVRSIVPPAFMTLLPLRLFVAARGLMGRMLCSLPSSSVMCQSLREAHHYSRGIDIVTQDSPLSVLWTPAMERLSGREIWLVPRLFVALLSVIFLDGSLWMMLAYDRLSTRMRGDMKSISTHQHTSSTPVVAPTFTFVAREAYQYGPPIEAIVLASSWPCLVFGVRPFTNNLETMALAFLLMIVTISGSAYEAAPSVSSNRDVPLLLLVGTTCSVGFFVRFTFAFFAFPVVVKFLWHRLKRTECRLGCFLSDAFWVAVSFMIVSYAIVWVDAGYYSWRESVPCDDSSCAATPTGIRGALKYIAPLNAFQYNSKSANLAEHGLHPRITHAVVNMPMLFGPLALAMYSSITHRAIVGKSKRPSSDSKSSTSCHWAILGGLLVLSCAPHQEPRFLLPATVPLVLLYGRSAVGSDESSDPVQRKSPKVVLSLRLFWIAFNAALYAFFGWLHQGGLVPSLLHLPREEAGAGAAVFYKTYMPPTFLAREGLSEKEEVTCEAAEEGESIEATCSDSRREVILDLQGADASVLLEVLRRWLPCPYHAENATTDVCSIRLISPQSVVLPLMDDASETKYSFVSTQSFRGHISTEDWPAFDGSATKFVNQLTLEVYRVTCTD